MAGHHPVSEPVTHYQSSRGPVLIRSMPYPHLKAAHAKLARGGFAMDRLGEVMAMRERLDELDAMASDADRIAASAPSPDPAPVAEAPPPAIVGADMRAAAARRGMIL